MQNKEGLKQKILEKSPFNFRTYISDAITFAEEKHNSEKRLSGEEFVIHPLNTALILAEIGTDTITIMAGILHSCFNKDEKIAEEIKEKFGEDVYNMITRVNEISNATKAEDTPHEIVTKYILNSSRDLRPILVKIAGAKHNVETVEILPEDMKKEKIQKALNIYGLIAEYLDLNNLKKKIEEEAFKVYKEHEYIAITKRMEEYHVDQDLLNKYLSFFKEITKNLDCYIDIRGRIKSKYSIYNKLKKYEKEWTKPNLERMGDILGFRFITTNEVDCFQIMESLMDNTELDYESFDDYISNPKPNGYMAMQGEIKIPEISDLGVEFQVLTEEMHHTNTYGTASHIAYKASKSRYAKPDSKYDWVEEVHKEFKKHRELREEKFSIPIKANIFENEIFVFTPKNQIIDLNSKDTVLDFAFRVHSEVGYSAIGAKIDNNAVPLSQIPNTGDMITIITQKGKTHQKENALSMVNSPSSKAKIIRALHKRV